MNILVAALMGILKFFPLSMINQQNDFIRRKEVELLINILKPAFIQHEYIETNSVMTLTINGDYLYLFAQIKKNVHNKSCFYVYKQCVFDNNCRVDSYSNTQQCFHLGFFT